MKNCPNCNVEVLDVYEICWNCQYSFAENRIITENEFKENCPKCNFVLESVSETCPECGYELNSEVPTSDDDLLCLRCRVAMKYMGSRTYQEDFVSGFRLDILNLFSKTDQFDLYCCPDCGKIEFYLPLIDK